MAEVESFIMLSARDVGSIAQYVGQSTLRVCVRAASVMLALAVFDYAWQRWQFEKSLRMSKQEIKEESKAQEGDPQIKARIRSIMREMARKRMMQDVPKATVVVTNPTHLAIALVYRREGDDGTRRSWPRGLGMSPNVCLRLLRRNMSFHSSRTSLSRSNSLGLSTLARSFQKVCIKLWRRSWHTCIGWRRGTRGQCFR